MKMEKINEKANVVCVLYFYNAFLGVLIPTLFLDNQFNCLRAGLEDIREFQHFGMKMFDLRFQIPEDF